MKIASVLFFLFGSILSFSQDKLEYDTNIEFGLGANSFSGDVCVGCGSIAGGIEVSSRFLITKKFFFRPEVNFNRFSSYGTSVEHHKFINNSFGLHLNIEYGLHRLSPSLFNKRAKREFYLSGLLGVLHHNPLTRINGELVVLQVHEIQGVTYNKFVPVLGGGVNFNFKLGKDHRVGARLELVYALSDYLDNTSNLDFENDVVLGTNETYSFDRSQFNMNNRNDFYLRFLLTYEFQLKTRHSEETFF